MKTFKEWIFGGSFSDTQKRLMILCVIYNLSKQFSYISMDEYRSVDSFELNGVEYGSAKISHILNLLERYKGVEVKYTHDKQYYFNRPQLKAMLCYARDNFMFLDEVLDDDNPSTD